MALPDGYTELLSKLSRAFGIYQLRTGRQAVVVGGAAAALYTDGAFMTGDVDVVAADDAAFHDAVASEGFKPEDRRNKQRGGFYHPDLPVYGVEQVSGPLFDGHSDPQKLVNVYVTDSSAIVLPSVEDMIADRLGQHAVSSPSDDSRLQQARMIFLLADAIDRDYLARRVLEEGGDIGLLDISSPKS